MKISLKVILSLFLSVFLAVSCSRKKDKFITRNFHAVTAKYNALYNGYNALESGKKSLNTTYFDNYWDVLPIERMQVFEDNVPGKSKNEHFIRAEEKATKAIQKHSMNIDGKEKNPQIDEAYLLLGKARYFDQRFIPALEAFNYILYKYPASDKINQAKIWREKANVRLDNNELAIKNLKRLLDRENLKDQELADATSILAQAYLNIKVVDSAIIQLKIASKNTKNNDERGRYQFIQGQLYNTLGFKDSANVAFDKVIQLNRKTPRIYLITAQLEKIKNSNLEKFSKSEIVELLSKLEKNRENRPFLDKIYHETAAFYLKNNLDSLAIVYYNKSLGVNSRDALLKAKNYETLGDINFKASFYPEAGKYYDSTLSNMVLNTKPYRVIKRKRDNLDDVIFYENQAKVTDSVLSLVKLTPQERLAYFQEYVKMLELKAEIEKEKRTSLKIVEGVSGNNFFAQQNKNAGTPTATVFYFYNPTTVAYGKNEFIKKWGDRALEDDWRWSSKGQIAGINKVNSTENFNEFITDEERYAPEYYMSKIPNKKPQIDSIHKARNYAYYQLGLIYKEKFKAYRLAKNKFESVLRNKPESRLILPSKYNLYKIYEALGQKEEAAIAKNNIISSYPDSRYATILSHPELVSKNDKNSPEYLYATLYKQYENQDYETVIAKCENYISVFDGAPIVAKLALLKATAIGRLLGYKAYSKAINYVAVAYANTPEGKQAQYIESHVLSKLSNEAFVKEENGKNNYKIIFKFENSKPQEIIDFQEMLNGVLGRIKYYKLFSSKDVYNANTTLVVVHGLKSAVVAKTFNQLLTKEDNKKIKIPYFVITSTNYKIIQIHKNLDAYLNIEI